jgi:hypothetical protein
VCRVLSWSPALAVALAACVLALAGCGSHAETKQDFVARADAICAATTRELRTAAGTPPSGVPAVARYLGDVIPLLERELKQLRALPRPAARRAELDRYLAAQAQIVARYRTLAGAVRHGDAGAVNRVLAALQSSPAAGLASSYGLSDCAGASGTGLPG